MTKNNKKGFTIIEVVLVLAIAGLIFLMVFIALPALQRSQRNTRRRQDMARILSAINDYQTNNNGKSPSTGTELKDFVIKYVDSACSLKQGGTDSTNYAKFENCGDQFMDPDGSSYGIINTYEEFVKAVEGTDYYDVDMGNLDGSNKEFNHWIHFVAGYKCSDSEGRVLKAGGKQIVSVMYTLEGNSVYCGDNE